MSTTISSFSAHVETHSKLSRIEQNDLPGAAVVAICQGDIVSRYVLCTYLLKHHYICVQLTRDVDLVQLLLKKMNNEQVDYDGNTLLHEAAQNGRLDIVDILLRHGADPNKANRWGITPFAKAIIHGRLYVVVRFLDEKIDFDKKDVYGNTFLHIAAQHGWLKIAEILLPSMHDINLPNMYNATPRDLAYQFGHVDIVNLISYEILKRLWK